MEQTLNMFEGVNWIDLANFGCQWRADVDTLMNLLFSQSR